MSRLVSREYSDHVKTEDLKQETLSEIHDNTSMPSQFLPLASGPHHLGIRCLGLCLLCGTSRKIKRTKVQIKDILLHMNNLELPGVYKTMI